MQVDDPTAVKVGALGLATLVGWLGSSFRSGRAVGRFEARMVAAEEDIATLKQDTAVLEKAIDDLDCIDSNDCLARQAEFHKLIQVQFSAGTREFDEIKKMILESNKASEERHNMLVKQLLSERR